MLKNLLTAVFTIIILSTGIAFANTQTQEKTKNILMVVTNSTGTPEHITGVWFDEYVIPYRAFLAKGYNVTVASPKGGDSPIDPASIKNGVSRIYTNARNILKNTEKLSNVNYKKYDAIVLPGGHGPLYDLATDNKLAEILEYADKNNVIIAAVCHGPAGLIGAQKEDGKSILYERNVTGFSNKEEELGGIKNIPFALETMLTSLGANYTSKAPWTSYVVVDKNLVTGQNPQSSRALAQTVIEMLSEK